MAAPQPINLCVIGCGAIARLHSRVARTVPGVRLMFASRSPEKAEQYRRKFRGTRAFGSYEEAAASTDVDALFICTPHAFHLDNVTMGAAHGKPMLVEKPITRTIDELDRMERTVVDAAAMCMVAENYFFKPLIPVLRGYLTAGAIGEPLFFELNKAGRSPKSGWRTDPELMGGGALLEGGVHWVNLLHQIAGPSSEVLAIKPETGHPPVAPFEDNLQVSVRFQSGAAGKLLHSWNTVNRIGGLQVSRIYGTEGNIVFESNGLWVFVAGRKKRFRLPGLIDIMGYRGMLKAFIDCVREGAEPAMSLARVRRDMEFVFAAYRSLDSGRLESTSR